jgi:hypothetical protein
MFVGHLGAGLAAKAFEPRMKLGTLVLAAYLCDIIAWIFVLGGLEHVAVPKDFGVRHLLTFDFPYTHSLVGSFVLAIAFTFAWASWGGRRSRRLGVYWDGIAIICITALSHWFLDVLMHMPDMPIFPGLSGLGLGLWRFQPYALILELVFAGTALAAYVIRCNQHPGRTFVVVAITAAAGALTVEGGYSQVALPDAPVMALSSLAVIALVFAGAVWADRSR